MRKLLGNIVAVAICAASVLLLSSCRDDLIPRRKFARLLADMYMEDGYLETRPDLRSMTDTLAVYKPIVESYGYTMEQYSNTLGHYVRDLKRWDDLFAEVKAILESRQTAVGMRIAKEKKERGEEVDYYGKSIWIRLTLDKGSIFEESFMKNFIDTTFGPHILVPEKTAHGKKGGTIKSDVKENEKDQSEIPVYMRRESD
ncbi:MAG: DUF4296 domain-containing protein [Bacteroidales bacterium]|jgi:hypothetical protein|nr:DUF4296 domain-containing protein [Bacteroidales bacterium]MCI2122126.1 DUF4296 domain-containing protein [Bacteroidales bacterium]MCI2145637.1 DUF4296 domain-containing protein [Bacteroidales bacterium]